LEALSDVEVLAVYYLNRLLPLVKIFLGGFNVFSYPIRRLRLVFIVHYLFYIVHNILYALTLYKIKIMETQIEIPLEIPFEYDEQYGWE
jgi:hypothetical protein